MNPLGELAKARGVGEIMQEHAVGCEVGRVGR